MMPKKIKLLIVDDSLIIRKAIVQYIKDYDIDIVGSVSNGESALKLFKRFKPHVVTLDITMPGLDGFTVLEQMIKINHDCKIIIITALKDKATGLKALKLGARSIIVKPFNPQKIKEIFNQIIDDI